MDHISDSINLFLRIATKKSTSNVLPFVWQGTMEVEKKYGMSKKEWWQVIDDK